jgi:hypothetical protein
VGSRQAAKSGDVTDVGTFSLRRDYVCHRGWQSITQR